MKISARSYCQCIGGILFTLLLNIPFISPSIAADQAINVGFKQITLIDKKWGAQDHQKRKVQSKTSAYIFYPTLASEKLSDFGVLKLSMAEDAQPLSAAEGKRGVILLSHGSGGNPLSYHQTIASLVQHGWIVAAPVHISNNFRDNKAAGSQENYKARPRLLSLLLDELLKDENFTSMIDHNRIAALGHSIGGNSALILAGGRPDITKVTLHCKENWNADPVFCDTGGLIQTGRNILKSLFGFTLGSYKEGTTGVPKGLDKRIKAVIALAPVGINFPEGGFKNLSVPVLMIRSGKDTVLRFPYHSENIAQVVPAQYLSYKTLEVDHFAYLSTLPEHLMEEICEENCSLNGFDRNNFLDLLHLRIKAFLDHSFITSNQ